MAVAATEAAAAAAAAEAAAAAGFDNICGHTYTSHEDERGASVRVIIYHIDNRLLDGYITSNAYALCMR